MATRVMPNNLEAEKSVLGACFLSKYALQKAIESLLPEAFYSEKISIPLKESIGEISGEFLLAYPPGIPVLCPGEIITKEVVDYVHDLKRANLYVQGTEDTTVENIKIVKK